MVDNWKVALLVVLTSRCTRDSRQGSSLVSWSSEGESQNGSTGTPLSRLRPNTQDELSTMMRSAMGLSLNILRSLTQTPFSVHRQLSLYTLKSISSPIGSSTHITCSAYSFWLAVNTPTSKQGRTPLRNQSTPGLSRIWPVTCLPSMSPIRIGKVLGLGLASRVVCSNVSSKSRMSVFLGVLRGGSLTLFLIKFSLFTSGSREVYTRPQQDYNRCSLNRVGQYYESGMPNYRVVIRQGCPRSVIPLMAAFSSDQKYTPSLIVQAMSIYYLRIISLSQSFSFGQVNFKYLFSKLPISYLIDCLPFSLFLVVPTFSLFFLVSELSLVLFSLFWEVSLFLVGRVFSLVLYFRWYGLSVGLVLLSGLRQDMFLRQNSCRLRVGRSEGLGVRDRPTDILLERLELDTLFFSLGLGRARREAERDVFWRRERLLTQWSVVRLLTLWKPFWTEKQLFYILIQGIVDPQQIRMQRVSSDDDMAPCRLAQVRFYHPQLYSSLLQDGPEHEPTLFLAELRKALFKQQYLKDKKKNGEFDLSAACRHQTEFLFKGLNLHLKPYSQVAHSTLTKLLFLINFGKTFDMKAHLNGFDFLQLLRLLCTDFPYSMVIQVLSIVSTHPLPKENSLLQETFLGVHLYKALFICLLYSSFLKEIEGLLESKRGQVRSVVEVVDRHGPYVLPPECVVYSVLLHLTDHGNQTVSYSTRCYHPRLLREMPNSPLDNHLHFLRALYENQEQEVFMKRQLLVLDREQKSLEEVSAVLAA